MVYPAYTLLPIVVGVPVAAYTFKVRPAPQKGCLDRVSSSQNAVSSLLQHPGDPGGHIIFTVVGSTAVFGSCAEERHDIL